jgi:hypothetical protein
MQPDEAYTTFSKHLPEQDRVQPEVRRARVLMQVDVSSPAVIGSEMEDDVDAIDRSARDFRVEQIAPQELHGALIDDLLDVLQLPAAQIVDDADRRAAGEERVHQRRADEGRPTRDEDLLGAPGVCHVTLLSSDAEPLRVPPMREPQTVPPEPFGDLLRGPRSSEPRSVGP